LTPGKTWQAIGRMLWGLGQSPEMEEKSHTASEGQLEDRAVRARGSILLRQGSSCCPPGRPDIRVHGPFRAPAAPFIGNDQRGNTLPMNTRQPMRHPLHIDQEQNNVIRAEVGERLRIILGLARPTKVPQRIRHLLNRLAKLDPEIEKKTSSSIEPSANEGWLRRLLAVRIR
jgi:hypothetical protein